MYDMGIFRFFTGFDIHQGIEEYRTTGGVLLDVRTQEEYREGYIPESKNLPLQEIGKAGEILPDKDMPVFVYCHSGARSGQAVEVLGRMGYTRVKNIGGIAAWRGKVER